MPDPEDSLGGETFSGEEQQDPAEQSLGDGHTMGGDTAAHSLGDQSTFGDANVDDELFDDGMELVDLSTRYTEEGVLGKGGFGEVMLAIDTRLGRKVAIKRIQGKAARSKTAVQRFLTEAKSMAELNHPNIVQIHDYGRSTDGPFLIMECVQGGSLLDLTRKGPIELDEAVNIFSQVCDGLAKAHAAGIIHRDIKPANILMTEDGVPKLTDFGLAKDDTADTGKTIEGAVIGTLDFMPPEQRQGAEFTDHRSDLWSLAATFYQIITGKSPKVINISSLPPKLQSVIAKSLEESKEERFQSAMEMREAILQAHSGNMDTSRSLGEGECPECAAPNPTHGKFCVGCGAVLQIQCLQCEAEIQIWNRACGECGSLQEPLVEKALADLKQIHDEAESLLAELEFDAAAIKAAVVASETDSRLQQFAGWHEDFVTRLEESGTLEYDRLAELLEEALTHEQAFDYESGLQTLKQVAPSLKRTNSIGIRDTAEELNERLTTKQSRLKELEWIVRERLTKDEHKGLLPLVDELLALKPDRPERRKLRAQLVKREEFITFLKNGDYEDALSLDPNNSKALAMKKTADIKSALASGNFETVLTLDPEHLGALAMKKAVEIKSALASGDYENALSLDPNNSKALAMKKAADIKAALDIGDYESALSLNRKNSKALAMKKAVEIKAALDSGDYENALSLDPNNSKALAMKKAVEIKAALASGDYENALSLDPNDFEARAMKEAVEIKAALASGDYENALSLDPSNVDALAAKKLISDQQTAIFYDTSAVTSKATRIRFSVAVASFIIFTVATVLFCINAAWTIQDPYIKAFIFNAIIAGCIMLLVTLYMVVIKKNFHTCDITDALVRTGFGGPKVTIHGRIFAFSLFHKVQRVTLRTLKGGWDKDDDFIFWTTDNVPIVINAEIYVRVPRKRAFIKKAACVMVSGKQIFCSPHSSPVQLADFVRTKLRSVMRIIVAQLTLKELCRIEHIVLRDKLEALLEVDLNENGLELETIGFGTFDRIPDSTRPQLVRDAVSNLDDIAVKLSSIFSGNESTTEIVSIIVDGEAATFVFAEDHVNAGDLSGDEIQYIAKEIRSKFTLAKRLPNLIASWGLVPEIGDRCSPQFLLICGEDYSNAALDVKFDLDEQLDSKASDTEPYPMRNSEGHWIFRFPFNLTTNGEDCNHGIYNMKLELNFAGLADPLLPTSLYCDIRLTIPDADADERVLEIDSDDKSLVNLQGLNLNKFSKVKLKGSGSGLINILQGQSDETDDEEYSADDGITQVYTLQVASKDEGNNNTRSQSAKRSTSKRPR